VQFVTLLFVLPSCLMTYLGEAAYLLKHPEGFANPYFYSLPQSAFWPVLVLATLASIVSAQSLITGAAALCHICRIPGISTAFVGVERGVESVA